MKTGSQGTFVISWSQTETDGLKAASLDVLAVGATWRWTGAPVRVDGPQGVLILTEAEGEADLRKRAARMVRRLIGAAVGNNVAGGSRRVTSYEDREVCTTRYRTEYQRELVGYDVTYRYDGRVYTTNTRHHPGDRIIHVRSRY